MFQVFPRPKYCRYREMVRGGKNCVLENIHTIRPLVEPNCYEVNLCTTAVQSVAFYLFPIKASFPFLRVFSIEPCIRGPELVLAYKIAEGLLTMRVFSLVLWYTVPDGDTVLVARELDVCI